MTRLPPEMQVRIRNMVKYISAYKGEVSNHEIMCATMQVFIASQIQKNRHTKDIDGDRLETLAHWDGFRKTMPPDMKAELEALA